MIPELNSPTLILYSLLLFFAILIIRYFLAAGIFYWYFYVFNFKKWKDFKLNTNKPDPKQYKAEIKWSIVTSSIFAIVGVLTLWLFQKGYTAIYLNFDQYGIWYLPVSLLLAMIIHETYYYWVHRLMHHPKLFKAVHKVHHDSLITSPWTAFSFHPWEGLLEAIILPVILMVIPMHYSVLLVYLILMTISSVINHLDIEIYPESFQKSMIGRWIIGASHHYYHHKEFVTNYGLYFTFWDKWMNTESDKYRSENQSK